MPLSLCLSLSIYIYISLSPSLYFSLSLFPPPLSLFSSSISLSVTIYLFLSLTHSLCLYVAHQSDAAILIVDVHTIVPMRVLVVDDSEANRKVHKYINAAQPTLF